MMTSTTKNKLLRALYIILPFVFWISLYEIAASLMGNEYFLPRLSTIFTTLFGMLLGKAFYLACLYTLLRVLSALMLGIMLGTLLGALSARFKLLYYLLNPFMTAVKATPVASLIIVLWILLSGNALAIVIAIFMVLPIIWQSTYNSFDTLDPGLIEVCNVFGLSRKYRFRALYLGNLKKYLLPSIITSVGLAWKSEIATEIIAYTKNSIGQLINDGKYNLDTPTVFAWTIVVICFSILFESLIKKLLGRVKV